MRYFIYCRKSTEAEDRQVASIESQLTTLERTFGGSSDIEIVDVYQEAYSAKAPGRSKFNEMMERLETGDAEGIIAWAPDRLARNSVDGGYIIYMLDRAVIRDLKFATYTFENNSQGKFMLQIMFGQSKYYSDALSDNVRRGNRTKLEKGEWPNKAPIGYLNDRETRSIVIDPNRHAVVRRMWDLMLTGAYTPRRIWELATTEWGLQTPKTKRQGGKPITLSATYNIFNNPFYAGLMAWRGHLHQGKHLPMITLSEFDRVQTILGRPGRPRPKTQTFAFTGFIRCGSCGLAVTAEIKRKVSGREYTYYHCTRRLTPKCTEPSIELKELENQVLSFLDSISPPDPIHRWALEELSRSSGSRKERDQATIASIEVALRDTSNRQTTLTDLRLRDLITDNEFISKREELQREALRLRQSLDQCQADSENWFEPARALLSFSNRAISWFQTGDHAEKRLILQTVGSNFSLTNKTLSIQAKKPFSRMSKNMDHPKLLGVLKDVRTIHDDPELAEIVANVQKLEERERRLSMTGVERAALAKAERDARRS